MFREIKLPAIVQLRELAFEKIRNLILASKFYIRSNNNKLNSIEAGRIVIAHLLPWSELEKCMHGTFF